MEANLREVISSITDEKVQNLIRELSSYGLGVCVPHMHSKSGEMMYLPHGVVQQESSLKISFTDKSRISTSDVAVAWRWKDGLEAFAYCKLEYPGGPHK